MPQRLVLRLASVPLAAILLLFTAAGHASPPTLGMRLQLDPATAAIAGELQVELAAGSHTFELGPGLAARGATTGDGNPLVLAAAGSQRYRVQLPEGQTLRLAWDGQLPDSARGFLRPEGGFLPADAGWYPLIDGLTEFALEIEVRVPAGQRAVATGSVYGTSELRDGSHRVTHRHPRIDGVVVATGPWQERTAEVNGILVRTLFPERLDAAHAQNYLDHSVEYLQEFAVRAGPYPYGSFTIAASPMPVGFAFPGFTLLGERVIPLPFIPRTSLAHELMHNWWGTGVRIDYATGNWSEALTTFMADYHLDTLRGEDRDTRHRWLLDLAALPPQLDRPLKTFRGGNQGADRIVGYNRGALLFRMLRETIGAETFDAGTRLFRDRHLFDRAGWDDLVRAFSDAAGRDLSDFFEPWITRPGMPELALHSVTQTQTADGWELRAVLEQTQRDAPFPLLGVPLEIETAGGAQRHHLDLADRDVEVRIALAQPATAIVADPDYELLRRLPDPPPILRTVSLDPQTRVVATQDGLEPLARRILGRPAQPADRFAADTPLLVIGSTEDVAQWLTAAGAPEAPGAVAERGHARMWTLPTTRTAAISADDVGRLHALVAALRHQAHRSFVVQDGEGRTRETGIWPSGDNPLRIELDGTEPR